MRTGINTKYSHTRAEMVRVVRCIRELRHLRGHVFEALDHELVKWWDRKDYWVSQNKTAPFFKPVETVSRLSMVFDVTCATCESLAGNPRLSEKTLDFYFGDYMRVVSSSKIDRRDFSDCFQSKEWLKTTNVNCKRMEPLCSKCRINFLAFAKRRHPETKPTPYWWTLDREDFQKRHRKRIKGFQIAATEWLSHRLKRAAA